MNSKNTIAIAVAIAIAAAAGYLLGTRQQHPQTPTVTAAPGDINGSRPATVKRPILYYRHPMGLKDTSPVPKKDAMGMDYVPVYADSQASLPGSVMLTPEKIQTLGVRTEHALRRRLSQDILASGTVTIAESRQRIVAARFDGWVDQLYVAASGAPVRAGQPLATIYSPELVAIQEEYLLAARAAGNSAPMRELAEASLARLRNLGISANSIARLQNTQAAQRTVTLAAPIGGILAEKSAIAGMRITAGESLFRLVDLSQVWVVAQVAEQELPRLAVGQAASFETAAHPGRRFTGNVSFVAPTVDGATRSVLARVELANSGGALKPGMFGRLTLGSAADDAEHLTVPVAAVIDSGTRTIVLLARPGGRFEPRDVRTGMRSGQWVEIVSGLEQGDLVVSAANFLIDAESNLRGALSGMTPAR